MRPPCDSPVMVGLVSLYTMDCISDKLYEFARPLCVLLIVDVLVEAMVRRTVLVVAGGANATWGWLTLGRPIGLPGVGCPKCESLWPLSGPLVVVRLASA
jgi:hypothetical protein